MVVLEVKIKVIHHNNTVTGRVGKQSGDWSGSFFFFFFFFFNTCLFIQTSHDDANDGNISKNKKNESNNAKRWNIVG